MPSETDVANAALRLIGANRITSFTDGSKNANAVQDIYAGVRDDLLRSHLWNFATKRTKLPRSSTAPSFGYDHAYVLPSDWLRSSTVSNNDGGTGAFDYSEEQVADQRCIVTSSDATYLAYVARVVDPNMMPADFVRALEVALARDLAIAVAESNTLQQIMADEAKRKLATARSTDAAGSVPPRRPRGSWASSRGGSWGNRRAGW